MSNLGLNLCIPVCPDTQGGIAGTLQHCGPVDAELRYERNKYTCNWIELEMGGSAWYASHEACDGFQLVRLQLHEVKWRRGDIMASTCLTGRVVDFAAGATIASQQSKQQGDMSTVH